MRLVALIAALGAGLAVSAAGVGGADTAPAPLPVSAHNCYPQDGQDGDRLARALALGIDNIEVDLGWDADTGRLIVGHDAAPRPGVAYPELKAYLVPALEAHWRTPRADGAPTVLTVDWKTSEPAAVRRFAAFLDAHPDWFSSAPKPADDRGGVSSLIPRRLTVCLTGEEAAKDAYDALVAPGGTYRAFRDTVHGAGAPYLDDPSGYAPRPASAYRRFLTLYWGHIERGGPPRAGDWTDADAARLATITTLAHRQGYRLRLYTLNGHLGGPLDSYRFADDRAARLRWRAARTAGVDWIATDEYADIVAFLRRADADPTGAR